MKSKGESLSEIVAVLANNPLFSKLSELFSASLARECRFMNVEKGGILFFQSDLSDSAYIVCSGTISIVLNSTDGREMVINEMHNCANYAALNLIWKQN